ncbi:50S ribosomal protein L25 [Sphaerochaeta globosa]|uniref:Large ribosomal subunit protein bL25 n=1 Tax=Sphaerochaeta globosa (strain ATCC BAA-1886 / DSM 22777 / Buddy) TaxID=158189 RepID=F0RWX9_SPHGB|nr:50S ribosomal protein L25 [Sphaerochaeta globosa]ADY13760.1 50S ribosomal protein L25 [Sphaerochaeta globosa str. Buddy]
MSDNKSLKAELRTEDFGSAGARRLLRTKRIPAVIYGKNEPVHIILDSREFTNKMRHFSETALLKISVGKKSYECLMKDYQENLMRAEIKHVDFFEVTRGQVLRTLVSIVLKGNPVGTKEGGVLDQVMHEVEIECFPKDLPAALEADVTSLKINQSLHLKDVVIPANVKVLDDLAKTVASVKGVKAEAVAPAEEAVAVAAPAEADKDAKAKK